MTGPFTKIQTIKKITDKEDTIRENIHIVFERPHSYHPPTQVHKTKLNLLIPANSQSINQIH